MRHLKLIKGRSYSGPGIRATNAKPFVSIENEAIADLAIASGYFVEVDGSDVPAGTVPNNTGGAGENGGDTGGDGGSNAGAPLTLPALRKLNKDALEAIAKKRGVDLSAAKNNNDRAALIFEDIEAKTKADADKAAAEAAAKANTANTPDSSGNPDGSGGSGGAGSAEDTNVSTNTGGEGGSTDQGGNGGSGDDEDADTTSQFTGNPDGSGGSGGDTE